MRLLPASVRLALAAGLLACSLFVRTAEATVVVPLTREQLIQRSDFVVRATVVAQQSRWNIAHTQIVTLTELRVTSVYKGQPPGSILTLRQWGGTVDGRTERVPGDAHFADGQDVVLFLRAGDGVVFLTALAQSVYFIDGSGTTTPLVRRDLTELTFATWQDGRMVLQPPRYEIVEPLDHLVTDIARLAGGAR